MTEESLTYTWDEGSQFWQDHICISKVLACAWKPQLHPCIWECTSPTRISLIKSDCLSDQYDGRSLQRRRSHSVNINVHHLNDGPSGTSKNCHTCCTVSQDPVGHIVTEVLCMGNQWCCCQQVHPLPNTHRFVRLLLMDVGQGVRSVRPTHRGYHQEGSVISGTGGSVKCVCTWRRNVSHWSLMIHVKSGRCEAGSDKAETKSKGVDIMYSGRGMPFRVVLSSLCVVGWKNGGSRTF